MTEEMKRLRPLVHHPDFRQALRQLDELEHTRIYCRHGLPHLLDVARIAALLAADRGLDCPRDVIYAAALLHDIGRVRQYTTGEPHAQAGVPMARELLRATAFTAAEQERIVRAVGRHQTGADADGLAQILSEADHASRMCFACAAADTCYWTEERRNHTVLL